MLSRSHLAAQTEDADAEVIAKVLLDDFNQSCLLIYKILPELISKQYIN